MLILLVAASLGFSVNRHYCMGHLVAERFFAMPDGCGADNDNHCNDEGQLLTMGCCENESLIFEGIDILSTAEQDLLSFEINPASGLPQFKPLVALPHAQINYRNFIRGHAPPGGKPLLIRYQRFLI